MSRSTSRNRRSSLPKSPRPSRAACLLTSVCPVSCLNHRSPATTATTCLLWLARTFPSRSLNSTRDFAGSSPLIVQRCRLSARSRRRNSSQRSNLEISMRALSTVSLSSVHSWTSGTGSKVSSSIKQTKPHPWETIEEDYPVGMILEGAVIRILTFGAIIELSEGVTGLLHISQISNDKIRKVEDVLNVGDVVKVRVLEVLKEERKVKLSMKGVEGNEGLFGREPGQATPPVKIGSDMDATDSTVVEVVETKPVEPEVVEPEAPAVENVEPKVVEPEAPAVENVEPKVVEPEAPAVENVEPKVVETKPEETEGPAEA